MTATETRAGGNGRIDRDPRINELCPPRRRDDDRLYAQWVLSVIPTMSSRGAYVAETDRKMWDVWQAEGRKVSAWQAAQAAGAVRVPARELRKGDVISMGPIADAALVTKANGHQYMAIQIEARHGGHGTAFPPDLKVTVFSRATPERDLPVLTVAELNRACEDLVTQLADYSGVHGDRLHARLSSVLDELHGRALAEQPVDWQARYEQLINELFKLADSFDYDKGGRSFSQEDCAEELREALARLQA